MAMSKKMVENLVSDIRLSSVVPGKITGENKTYELKGLDIAMKLHYLNALYFFNNTNINGTSNNNEGENLNSSNSGNGNNSSNRSSFMSIHEMKNVPMYDWLISYFMTCGRIRVSSEETGDRPSIKLNDAGIKLVEAQTTKTVDEWLAMEDFMSLQDQLVYNHDLGPDLSFSPLVCLQVTWFKCGGISMGLSWAHILGDAFSASEFMNMWSQYMQGNHQYPKILSLHQDPPKPNHHLQSNPAHEPNSVKRVGPVDNHWVLPTNCKIGTHSFQLTPKQLGELHSKVHGSNNNSSSQCFEVIAAIFWRCIAKVRKDLDTKNVTICRPKTINRQQGIPYNGQVLGTIEADVPISSADPLKLVHMIVENVIDEGDMIEEMVNKEVGKFDFTLYGTNLTFVDMEEADVYFFKLKGNSPTFASYTIGGVQDKGAILVLPGSKNGGTTTEGNIGKLVVLHLPENEIEPLKNELKEKWCIA